VPLLLPHANIAEKQVGRAAKHLIFADIDIFRLKIGTIGIAFLLTDDYEEL
jgi:hypothetical protein